MSIKTEHINVTSPNGTFSAYLAIPAKTPAPGVIVIQEIFGVNDHIQDVTRRVAEAGYVALSPDLFWQVQPGFTCGYSPEEVEVARGLMEKVSLDIAVEDVKATMELLSSRPEVKGTGLGVTGFCWGGLLTFLVSCRLNPAVSAAYYGGRIAEFVDEAPGINNPMLFHFGELDTGITMDQVVRVQKAVEGKPDVEVHVYPKAAHGFHCDHRGSYHEPSAKLAWERTMKFFGAHLG